MDFTKYSWKTYDEIYKGPQQEAIDNLIREQAIEKMEDSKSHAD